MDIYQTVSEFYKEVQTEKRIIGKSYAERNLYAVKIGDGNPVGIAQYAMHGREFITAKLALEHCRQGISVGSCWILPLMNPDGALLSEVGLNSVEGRGNQEKLLSLNKGNDDFLLWKANLRGVDLNVNFDARWGKGDKNVKTAGVENYIGEKPFSEPETLALKKFTLSIKPNYTVSYHTKGEEIYWYFGQPIRDCVRDKQLALMLSQTTGYKLAYAKGSAGGYKDWCIQKLKIPSFTIEVGNDEMRHPIREDGLADILEKNRYVLRDLSKEIKG